MDRIFHDDKIPNGFEENFEYSAEVPYTIRIKHFREEDIVPLHYAKTVEILVCDDLLGQIIIDNKRYELRGQQVFVIPPYTVHANDIYMCNGRLYVFKVSLPDIAHYVDIPNILESVDCSLDQLAYVCPDHAAVKKLIDELVARDGNLCACLPLVLEIFCILSNYTQTPRENSHDSSRLNAASLQELINWTQKNYMFKISLDDVAQMMGYSKYYFCARFKTLTGITYMNYLNSVRISNACLLLQNGHSVQNVCSACGFENISYFIQVFKKIRHMTPHQYASQYQLYKNS